MLLRFKIQNSSSVLASLCQGILPKLQLLSICFKFSSVLSYKASNFYTLDLACSHEPIQKFAKRYNTWMSGVRWREAPGWSWYPCKTQALGWPPRCWRRGWRPWRCACSPGGHCATGSCIWRPEIFEKNHKTAEKQELKASKKQSNLIVMFWVSGWVSKGPEWNRPLFIL